MKKILISLFVIGSFWFLLPGNSAAAASLSGRIFLQVQDKGQAWYVYPLDSKRYYLGRPTDAFDIMRKLGLGVSEKDFYAAAIKAPQNLSGRIILRVENKGQAYYVDPVSGHLNYLGRPEDAYRVIRSLGQGITNADLNRILIGALSTGPGPVVTPPVVLGPDQKLVQFSWKYDGKNYLLDEVLSKSLYTQYSGMSRVLTYRTGEEPANMRDAFYAMFLTPRSGDGTLDKVLNDLKKIAAQNNLTGDKLVEFMMAFVQYIPYDSAKVTGTNLPNYLYETLYRNSGVCSDKSFLAVAMLRKLGYGAAILDYPDNKHSAAGVACAAGESTNGSGYCFVETTNFFPIGVVPSSLKLGQAESSNQFNALFDGSNLGAMEIYQRTTAKSYTGVSQTMARAEVIKKLVQSINDERTDLNTISLELASDRNNLDALRASMNSYQASGDINAYNQLIPQYNEAARNYNDKVANYQLKIDIYNGNIREYNSQTKSFYQQS